MNSKIYDFIFSTINPFIKGSILEAGCGAGNFGPEIVQNKNNVNLVGVDINKSLLSDAYKTGAYRKTVCGDLNNKKIFNAESFETIIATLVIHHFPDIRPVINNFYYWLKPGGSLIIIDPNGSNPVLKLSFYLRKLFSKFINTVDYFSVNESHKSIPEFQKSLKKFEIRKIVTFNYEVKDKFKFLPFKLTTLFFISQRILLKFYRFFSLSKYKGSSLIIIASKT